MNNSGVSSDFGWCRGPSNKRIFCDYIEISCIIRPIRGDTSLVLRLKMCYMRPGSLLSWVRTGSSERFWLTREWNFDVHESRKFLQSKMNNSSRKAGAHGVRNLWWDTKGSSFVALNVHHLQALSKFCGVWKFRFRISFHSTWGSLREANGCFITCLSTSAPRVPTEWRKKEN